MKDVENGNTFGIPPKKDSEDSDEELKYDQKEEQKKDEDLNLDNLIHRITFLKNNTTIGLFDCCRNRPVKASKG